MAACLIRMLKSISNRRTARRHATGSSDPAIPTAPRRSCRSIEAAAAHCPAGYTQAAPGHVGRGPGLVDEDEVLRIEVDLALEPGAAPLQDVRAILLAGMSGPFLRVIACRRKKRWMVPKPNTWPFSANDRRSSSMVISGVSLSRDSINGLQASTRPERRLPPNAFGCASPCDRSRARQRLTLAALTPKRSPAARWLSPPETAARTRIRRSTDRALDISAGLRPRQIV